VRRDDLGRVGDLENIERNVKWLLASGLDGASLNDLAARAGVDMAVVAAGIEQARRDLDLGYTQEGTEDVAIGDLFGDLLEGQENVSLRTLYERLIGPVDRGSWGIPQK